MLNVKEGIEGDGTQVEGQGFVVYKQLRIQEYRVGDKRKAKD